MFRFVMPVTCLIMVTLTVPICAAEQDNVNDIILKTERLYKQGIKIHQQYDFNILDHVRACVAKYGGLRGEAKKLQARARALKEMQPRYHLTLATDDAFACVYCGGTGKYCATIPAELLAAKP